LPKIIIFASNKTQKKKMNLLNFISSYPDESSCRSKFKEYRDREGVICPHCGSRDHYWKSDKSCYECKKCKYRQSLRANTVMHASNLPFRYWFIAIHLQTSTKKSFSAVELQRQPGYKRYGLFGILFCHTVNFVFCHEYTNFYEWIATWFVHWRQKISDNLWAGTVWMMFFFTTDTEESGKDKPLKRGRGSQRKTKVLVMAESVRLEGKSTKKKLKKYCRGYI
jgi:hypothetical protein